MKIERSFLLAGHLLSTSAFVDVHAPWDGRLVARVAQAGPVEAWLAASAAIGAFPTTRRLPARQRAAMLLHTAAALRDLRDELAVLLCDEGGKPVTLGRAEVDRAVSTLEACATEALRNDVGLDPGAGPGARVVVTRAAPRGPTLAFTSFASPLLGVARKLGAAVAAGCPIVIRPCSRTPSVALTLGLALLEAGWPPDALSVLPCDDTVADRLVADPRFATVTFSGRARAAWGIHARANRRGLAFDREVPVTMLVEPDADLDAAIPALARDTYAHAGQLHTSLQRVFVHERVHAEVCDRFAEAAARVPRGDPGGADVICGPMIDADGVSRVATWLRRAESIGARRVTGGERSGNLVSPAVVAVEGQLADLLNDASSGPVVVLEPYRTLDEAIDRVNRQRPGSDTGIYTRSLPKVWRLFEQLDGRSVVHNGHPNGLETPSSDAAGACPVTNDARASIEALSEARTLVVAPAALDA
ncbi:MAG: aldehyde dehydrogenase family protein [Pseudomonadota bacterium]|nr:aldehyde dehydrogenase family protein [Pseudomonadota bacterium]